jgi:hypothetical protein
VSEHAFRPEQKETATDPIVPKLKVGNTQTVPNMASDSGT